MILENLMMSTTYFKLGNISFDNSLVETTAQTYKRIDRQIDRQADTM